MVDSHGGSITAWDCLVRRPQRPARPLIDRDVGDATGMRARMPHGRVERRQHGAAAPMMTKGPQEMTVRARLGVVADLASSRTHFVPDSSSAGWYGLSANGRTPKPTSSIGRSILRRVDQQPFDLPGGDRLEVFRDQVDVPVLKVDRGWLDYVPRAPDVKAQIVREHEPVAG